MALTQMQAILAAIGVVVAVIIAWKFLKFAFRIGLIIVAAAILFFVLRSAGYLGGS